MAAEEDVLCRTPLIAVVITEGELNMTFPP